MKNKLNEILMVDDIVTSIKCNIDILTHLIPEIKDMIGFPHNHPHHHLDVWNHTLLALSLSENDFEIRLCLLLHDIGKPHCYQDAEVRHFEGHPICSSFMAKNILERLNYDIDFINEVCYLIEKHDIKIEESEIIDNYDLEYKRFKIQCCDALAHNPEKLENRKKYIEEMEEKFINIKVKKLKSN